MERGYIMVIHSSIIGILLYLFMLFVLKQNPIVAENRSIVLSSIALIYMIIFGHKLPTSINPNL